MPERGTLTRIGLTVLALTAAEIAADMASSPQRALAQTAVSSQAYLAESYKVADLRSSEGLVSALITQGGVTEIFGVDFQSSGAALLRKQAQLPFTANFLASSTHSPDFKIATPAWSDSEYSGRYFQLLSGEPILRSIRGGQVGHGAISPDNTFWVAQHIKGDGGNLHVIRKNLQSEGVEEFEVPGLRDDEIITQMTDLVYNPVTQSHSQYASSSAHEGFLRLNYFQDRVESTSVNPQAKLQRAGDLGSFYNGSTPYVWFLDNNPKGKKIFEVRNDTEIRRVIEPARGLGWPKNVQRPNLPLMSDSYHFSAMALDSEGNKAYLGGFRSLRFGTSEDFKNNQTFSFPFLEVRELRDTEATPRIFPLTESLGQSVIWKMVLGKNNGQKYPIFSASSLGREALYTLNPNTGDVSQISDHFSVRVPMAARNR